MSESKHRQRRAELYRIARERGYSEAPKYLLVNGAWWDTRSGNQCASNPTLKSSRLEWLHMSYARQQMANPRAG